MSRTRSRPSRCPAQSTGVQYDVGYLTNIKPRDSNDFISMSREAGASGDNEGLVLTILTLTPIKGLKIYTGNYYAVDVFNTAFGSAGYTGPARGRASDAEEVVRSL